MVLRFSSPKVLRSGLGLLETTMAIGVIVTGLFAAFTLVLANSRAAEETNAQFGATQAAREGIEVVRAIRDSNWLAERARRWDEGIDGSAGAYTAVAVFEPVGPSWRLEYGPATLDDPSTRIIRRGSGSDVHWTQGEGGEEVAATPYRRLVSVHPICADGRIVESGAACDAEASPPNPKVGMRVRSRVQWTSRGNTHEVIAEERMYNWR